MRGTAGLQRTTVWLQQSLLMEGDRPFPEERNVRGRTIVGYGSARLNIDPRGNVDTCVVVKEAEAGVGPVCAAVFDRFVPLNAGPGPASATLSYNVSTAPVVGTRPSVRRRR
jgi:hypothetical protein